MGGQMIARAVDGNPDVARVLLRAPGGQSAYEVACPGDGKRLVVRHVTPREGERRLKASERAAPLSAPLAGTPALVGSWLLLPLANGDFARLPLPLPEKAVPELGDNWRSRKAGPEARCYLVALGNDRFLSTDGGRGLTVWQWPANGLRSLPPDADRPTLELPDRIVAAPLVLPQNGGAGPLQVCVADLAGNVSLLNVLGNGQLEVKKRAWNLAGTITAGPYLASTDANGVRVACVVDGRRLVWLDPAKADPVWKYETGGQAIVGQPRLVGGVLVVADQGGRFVALDPTTGEQRGPGYTLRGSVAPAASPVAFGPDRAFAPLSDGTALLLPVPRITGVKE
jgi:hypothetical protein